MHNEVTHRQNEKTIYELGENICKWCDQQGLNFQNTQRALTIQQQQQQTTQLKNGQKPK